MRMDRNEFREHLKKQIRENKALHKALKERFGDEELPFQINYLNDQLDSSKKQSKAMALLLAELLDGLGVYHHIGNAMKAEMTKPFSVAEAAKKFDRLNPRENPVQRYEPPSPPPSFEEEKPEPPPPPPPPPVEEEKLEGVKSSSSIATEDMPSTESEREPSQGRPHMSVGSLPSEELEGSTLPLSTGDRPHMSVGSLPSAELEGSTLPLGTGSSGERFASPPAAPPAVPPNVIESQQKREEAMEKLMMYRDQMKQMRAEGFSQADVDAMEKKVLQVIEEMKHHSGVLRAAGMKPKAQRRLSLGESPQSGDRTATEAEMEWVRKALDESSVEEGPLAERKTGDEPFSAPLSPIAEQESAISVSQTSVIPVEALNKEGGFARVNASDLSSASSSISEERKETAANPDLDNGATGSQIQDAIVAGAGDVSMQVASPAAELPQEPSASRGLSSGLVDSPAQPPSESSASSLSSLSSASSLSGLAPAGEPRDPLGYPAAHAPGLPAAGGPGGRGGLPVAGAPPAPPMGFPVGIPEGLPVGALPVAGAPPAAGAPPVAAAPAGGAPGAAPAAAGAPASAPEVSSSGSGVPARAAWPTLYPKAARFYFGKADYAKLERFLVMDARGLPKLRPGVMGRRSPESMMKLTKLIWKSYRNTWEIPQLKVGIKAPKERIFMQMAEIRQLLIAHNRYTKQSEPQYAQKAQSIRQLINNAAKTAARRMGGPGAGAAPGAAGAAAGAAAGDVTGDPSNESVARLATRPQEAASGAMGSRAFNRPMVNGMGEAVAGLDPSAIDPIKTLRGDKSGTFMFAPKDTDKAAAYGFGKEVFDLNLKVKKRDRQRDEFRQPKLKRNRFR